MAALGRPPKPVEQKRRVGRAPGRDSGGRKLPEPRDVVALPMGPAGGPEMPADLLLPGRELWAQVWTDGLSWISPVTDLAEATEACRLADDVAVARERYRATREPADARTVAALSKSLTEALSVLGFNPTARSRLGVAEVRRVSALEHLLAQRQTR
jgi:hypothetical protein